MAYFSAAELKLMADAGVIAPAITPEMLSYCRLRYALIGAGLLYSVLTLFALLHSGLARKLSDFCARLTRNKWLLVPLYYICLAVLIMLIRYPFSYLAGYQVEHSYGLSHQSLGEWLFDLIKARAVDAGLTALGFTIAFGLIDKFPKRWPVILWSVLVPLIAAGIFLAPLLIDPLFNKFTPMPAGPQRDGIERVAALSGIPNAAIFIVDKSRQTTKLNAYVTGLGSSTRIVIWDNTLQKLPQDQIEAIVAHEAGHYVLGHIVLGFALVSAGLLALLLLAQKLSSFVLSRLPVSWGIRGWTDPQAISVILLFITVGSFIFAPVENAMSREMERQADAFGLKVTKNPVAMARVFVSLSQQNLSEPAPPAIIQFWFFGHPSLRERILSALRPH